MNCRLNPQNPRNSRTSPMDAGVGHARMVSIFSGLMLKPFVLTTCPRNSSSVT